MAQHTINLPCIADTYVDEENRYTNYGSATSLKVSNSYVNSHNSYRQSAFFRFDISLIPRNKKVTKLALRVFVESIDIYPDSYIWYDNYSNFDEYSANCETNWVTPYGTTREIGGLISGQYNDFTLNRSYWNGNFVLTAGAYGGYPKYPKISIASRETANPPILVVTYEDVPPSKPTLVEPIGSYERNSQVIRLSWNYISGVGGAQKAFALQWSMDGVEWNTVTQTTPNTYYDVGAETFPAGNIYWRVRTYNEYDEASEYSDVAAFYAIGSPEIPVIQSVSNKMRPEISWASTNQQVFQIQILKESSVIHDSGIIPGMQIRAYKVPGYLQNGLYEVRIRIKNEYDLYSEWGSASFIVNVVQPPKPILNIQRTIYGFEMHIVNVSDRVLIYRKEGAAFICVASVSGGWFTDNSVASEREYEYFVRSINTGEAFSDSDIVSMKAILRNNLFAPASDLGDMITLRFNKNTIPGKNQSLNPSGVSTFFSGRTHVVTEFSEHEESAITFSFFFRETETVERFKALIRKKETVLFRDARGKKMYGTLGGWNAVDDRGGYQVSFVLTETDYNEEIEG